MSSIKICTEKIPPSPVKSPFKLLCSLALFFFITGIAPKIASARNFLPGLLPKKSLPVELKRVTAKTKVGSWVEYAAQNKAKGQRFTWRISLLKKEGKNKQWWEYFLRWGRMRSVVIKILVKSTKHDPTKIVKMIWKPAGHQAVLLPVKAGKKMMDIYTPRFNGRITKAGTSPLTVVAGTFRTKHYTAKDRQGKKLQFWVSDAVPVLGLVKLLSPHMRLELIKYGQNAKTMITEKPGKLPFPVK